MATAIMILSNEGGKDSAVIVAASREDAKAVAGIAKKPPGPSTWEQRLRRP